jgi:hypothetical protein
LRDGDPNLAERVRSMKRLKPFLMLLLIGLGFLFEFLVEFPFRLTLWLSGRR